MVMDENNSRKKMVVFDMDNTLLRGRFIDTCSQQYNFSQALGLLRQIDHDQVSLTVRIASFLKDRSRSELIDIAEAIPMVEDILTVVNELKKRSFIIGIISDSYQLITDHFAKKLGADFSMGNELQYEGEILTGQVLIPSYFHYSEQSSCKHQVCKTNALRYITNKYRVKLEDCVVVGDSENDVCMIRHAGLGVAFCTTNELLRNVASRHIEQTSFGELLKFTN
jgi:HAD superfamily phosphoserine phosphatase-like hydrolase